MAGFIETAVVTATMAISGSQQVFDFGDAPGSQVGDTVVAIVQVHNVRSVPTPSGWFKVAEVVNPDGPRVYAFAKQKVSSTERFVIRANQTSRKPDRNSSAYLVTLTPPIGLSPFAFSYDVFYGTESFADMESFKSPVPIYQGASDPSTRFVWAAFDNTVAYNASGPEGYVVDGTGVSMPVYASPIAVNPTVLNFNVDRSVGPGPGTAHNVQYAGIVLKFFSN